MDDAPNQTLRVLEKIQGDISGLRTEVTSLRTDMNAGFAAVAARIDGTNTRIDGTNTRIDGVIEIVGRHHGELEARVTRIENHLELR